MVDEKSRLQSEHLSLPAVEGLLALTAGAAFLLDGTVVNFGTRLAIFTVLSAWAQLAKDQEGELVVAGRAPQREREHERIDLVLLPERQLLVLMLRRLVEDVMFGAKRHGPAVVGLLADPGGELAMAG